MQTRPLRSGENASRRTPVMSSGLASVTSGTHSAHARCTQNGGSLPAQEHPHTHVSQPSDRVLWIFVHLPCQHEACTWLCAGELLYYSCRGKAKGRPDSGTDFCHRGNSHHHGSRHGSTPMTCCPAGPQGIAPTPNVRLGRCQPQTRFAECHTPNKPWAKGSQNTWISNQHHRAELQQIARTVGRPYSA